MFKVLIAEDEKLIREGLASSIQWEKYNLRVVGKASSGREAIELFKKYKPDILITDIKMPFHDGLEVIKYAKCIKNNLKCIIISGYDDFEYARTAIKLGVSDYILKPIELEKVEQKLAELIVELADQKKKEENIRIAIRTLRKYILIESVYGNPIDSNNFLKINGEYLINRNAYFDFYLTDIRIDEKLINITQDIELFLDRIIDKVRNSDDNNICEDVELEMFLLNRYQEKIRIGVVFFSEKNHTLNSIAEKYLLQIKKLIPIGDIVSGGLVDNLQKLHHSYTTARLKLLLKKTLNIEKEVLDKDYTDNQITQLFKIDLLLKFIREGNTYAVKRWFDNLEDVMRNSEEELNLSVIARLYFSISKLSDECGINLPKSMGFDENTVVEDRINIFTLFYKLKYVVFSIITRFSTRDKNYARDLIEKAKKYIDEHYADWDLSLEKLADYLNLNPSYLSSLFKDTCGISYIEYLTRCRLEKAKQFLKDPKVKIGYVAKKIGYNNKAYFNFLFKKYFGITPTDYRANSP